MNKRPPDVDPVALNLRVKSFLNVTTSEKKNGFLLIEVFSKLKLWPPGFDPWWPFLVMQR